MRREGEEREKRRTNESERGEGKRVGEYSTEEVTAVPLVPQLGVVVFFALLPDTLIDLGIFLAIQFLLEAKPRTR